uniref:Uncharacterized protein n=1 Tax=Anguilla anguilla TaxID=7936 RepID=A0A0E9XRQ2_ANGAN
MTLGPYLTDVFPEPADVEKSKPLLIRVDKVLLEVCHSFISSQVQSVCAYVCVCAFVCV